MKLKKTIFLLACALSVLSGNSFGAESGKELKKVSFIPMWVPQAQFAGYYMALEKGIYQKHGLEVEILPSGPNTPPEKLLKAGQAEFGLLWLSAGIQERSRGTRLVNIAQELPRSALILVAKKSSAIDEIQDIDGKKVSMWAGALEIQPRALIQKYNLKVKVIPQTETVNLFLRGGVDVVSAMWYNEYHVILNSGLNPEELTCFFFNDYGLNFPEDGIYVMENTYLKDPARCSAFVKASREGWDYAFAHEPETVDLVLKLMEAAGLVANRAHQKWMLEKMQELMELGASVPGEFSPLQEKDYRTLAAELKKAKMIDNIPDFNKFYRNVLDAEK